MLNLLKKADGVEARETPAWRPDFRKLNKLPDIKAVRTSFFINMTAGAAAFGALLFTGMREYNIFDLSGDLAKTNASIASLEIPSTKAYNTYVKFQSEAKIIDEVQIFLGSEKPRSDLLLHLAGGLPESIALSRIEQRGGNLVIAGVVRGNYTEGVSVVSAYERQLRDDTELKREFATVSQGSISRSGESGSARVLFEITLNPPAPSKTPAKK
jgi:hypothetical protein